MNTQDLKDVLMVQTATYKTKQMNVFIKQKLKDIECSYYEDNGNIYVTKGDAETYPCIISHTDTVHNIEKHFDIIEHEGVLFAINTMNYSRLGIGGDDKVGVFICLEVLKNVDTCKVAFFRDEEIGCVGSRKADMAFFNNVEFVLQCDRQGYKDFVDSIFSTELYTPEFSLKINDILNMYNRIETDGGLTDVYQLVENGLNVCVANMSCGYYRPHTDEEYVIIEDVFDTLQMVYDLFQELSGTVWVYNKNRKEFEFEDNNWNVFDERIIEDNHEQCTICGGYNTYHDEYEGLGYCFNCQEYYPVNKRY